MSKKVKERSIQFIKKLDPYTKLQWKCKCGRTFQTDPSNKHLSNMVQVDNYGLCPQCPSCKVLSIPELCSHCGVILTPFNTSKRLQTCLECNEELIACGYNT